MTEPGSVHAALLTQVPDLDSLSEEQRAKVAALARWVEAPVNTVLFREGDAADEVSLIVEGRISLSMRLGSQGESTVLTLAPGEIVGWSGLKSHGRVATGRVIEATRLLTMNGRALLDLCEEDHEIGYLMMKKIFDEMSRRLHDTRLQLLDMFGRPSQ